jgi:hypothetical protein
LVGGPFEHTPLQRELIDDLKPLAADLVVGLLTDGGRLVAPFADHLDPDAVVEDVDSELDPTLAVLKCVRNQLAGHEQRDRDRLPGT